MVCLNQSLINAVSENGAFRCLIKETMPPLRQSDKINSRHHHTSSLIFSHKLVRPTPTATPASSIDISVVHMKTNVLIPISKKEEMGSKQ